MRCNRTACCLASQDEIVFSLSTKAVTKARSTLNTITYIPGDAASRGMHRGIHLRQNCMCERDCAQLCKAALSHGM